MNLSIPRLSVLPLPILAAAAFVLIAACGGGGSPNVSTTTPTENPNINPTPPEPPEPPAPPPNPTPTLMLTSPISANGMPRAENAIILSGITLTSFSAPSANHLPHLYYDGEYSVNYGIAKINAVEAFGRGLLGANITVAVVDSGVSVSHPNFTNNRNINRIAMDAARRFDRDGNALTSGALIDPTTILITNGTTMTIGSHGTEVAAIIGGSFNGPDGYGHGVAPVAPILPLRLSDLTPSTRQGENIPQFHLGGNPEAAFRYATSLSVHIINNSWGSGFDYYGHYGGDQSKTIFFRAPILRQLLQVPGVNDGIRHLINVHSSIFGNEDIAVVWAAGNEGWNSTNGIIQITEAEDYTTPITMSPAMTTYTPQQLVDNFVAVEVFNGATVSISFAGATLNLQHNAVNISATIDAFEPNGFGDYALAPLYHPRLLGRYLAVVATDENDEIASFSNGCGSKGKYWCLAAPGVNITTASAQSNDPRRVNGTSFSAPHVSGALALLKSRFPQMSMSVLVHLLLETATEINGDGIEDVDGVDNVYGHGLLNVGAAILAQSSVTLMVPSTQGIFLRNAQTELPSSFAGFAKRLNGVAVAAEYLDGFYYDAPLGGMIKTQSKKQPPLNFAAEVFDNNKAQTADGVFAFAKNGALRAAGLQHGALQVRHNWLNKPSLWQNTNGEFERRPFFADDSGQSDEMLLDIGTNFRAFAARGEEQTAEYSQLGLLWQQEFERLQMAAAFSHIDEHDTLLGGKFGGAMPLTDGGQIRQTDIGATFSLGKFGGGGKWRAFANYQRADIDAHFGGIVGEVSGLAAEGWRGGLTAQNWLRYGDSFRIGIGRETAINRGDMILQLSRASNPQKDENTQIIRNRGYRVEEQRISLDSDTPMFMAIGYGFAPGENSRLSFGINYHPQSTSALSIDWRWDF